MHVESEVISGSRTKMIVLVLVSLGFVAVALSVPDANITNWNIWRPLIVVFFGIGAAVLSLSLFRPHRLHLDAQGFTLKGGFLRKPYTYSWQDVEGFRPFRVSALSSLVGFDFSPAAKRDGTLAKLNRAMGIDAALPGSWPMSAARMAEYLNDYRARALGLRR
jgi:hypothetical protein